MARLIVLLDTNALLMPFQFSIDLEGELKRLLGEHEVLVPSSSLEELRRLSKTSRKARAALQLTDRFRTVEVKGRGDDALLEAAKEREAIVLTNDRKLRRRLREAGLPVVFLRGRGKLEAHGIGTK